VTAPALPESHDRRGEIADLSGRLTVFSGCRPRGCVQLICLERAVHRPGDPEVGAPNICSAPTVALHGRADAPALAARRGLESGPRR
jgi:hypothetical protein